MRLVITRPNRIELFRDGVSERVASFELLPAQDLVDGFAYTWTRVKGDG
jgi:hypothetical protein